MILGIETSCDETSVALLERDGTVRVNLIASQIERHRPFGGVVPEIASREHLQHLFPLVTRALDETKASWSDLEQIAVTARPGLIGALLVGVAGAQGLSYALDVPLIAVNHLEGHLFSPYLQREGAAIKLPERFLSLVISGGHSSIYDVRVVADASPAAGRPRAAAPTRVAMLNRTRDDAIGETFDKVAKFVGLSYPGGPQIEKHAKEGTIDRQRFPLPVPRFKDESLDFSYSGIKAGAIRIAREKRIRVDGDPRAFADFCATFQDALFAQLFDRLNAIWLTLLQPMPTEVAIAGGVAANGTLRQQMLAWGRERSVIVRLPEAQYCTDNAAMIAFAALQSSAETTDPLCVTARSRVA